MTTECCRTLELTLISAKDLVKPSSTTKSDNVYAVVNISGSMYGSITTPVDKKGGSTPRWNCRMEFTINEAAALVNYLTLVIKLKAVRTFWDKNLGEVRVPIKKLMEEGKDMQQQQAVVYHVKGKSNEPQGSLSFTYRFGKMYKNPVYPPVDDDDDDDYFPCF
ncbi:SRC2-like protein [Tanacetum coccineum]